MAVFTQIPLSAARVLLLNGLGLLDDASGKASTRSILSEIERLGFVQLDSINIVERAHHHILWTRHHNYRPDTLHKLQAAGSIFEHWTHDASVIPAKWFPHWKHRFVHIAWEPWLLRQMGPDYQALLDAVIGRIDTEGPLAARDFEHRTARGGTWWDWKPAKAALEYHWRRGALAIPQRIGFEKVYDLTHRVLPKVHETPAPELAEHIDWACSAAMHRLGVATPRELAGFWGLIKPAQAASWCAIAAGRGQIVPVSVEGASTKLQPVARTTYARADWRRCVAAAPAPILEMRILNPFDPLIRDRSRCVRLFGFEYRFEAFVPTPKRKYGYYVLPILKGDRLIGRLDPKFDRAAGKLLVHGVWWEAGVKNTKGLKRELEGALERYCRLLGAADFEIAERGGGPATLGH